MNVGVADGYEKEPVILYAHDPTKTIGTMTPVLLEQIQAWVVADTGNPALASDEREKRGRLR